MTCATCGNEAPEQADQCPRCGAQLANAAAAPATSWGPPGGAGTPVGPPPSPTGWDAPSSGGAPSYGGPPTGAPQYGGGQEFGGGQQSGAPQYGGGQPFGGGPGGFGGQAYPGYPPTADLGGRPALAGWWRRVGATLIDGVILFVVAAVVRAIFGAVGGEFVDLLVGLAYVTVLLVTRGQTVGMMAVSTRCVQESTGSNLTWGPAIGRYLLYAVLAVTVIGGILDALWPLWDGKNQTLHDKAVGSVVVMTG